MKPGISLANKSQLLFGVAVMVILGGSLAVPWFWIGMNANETQLEIMRQLADAWTLGELGTGVDNRSVDLAGLPEEYSVKFHEPVRMSVVPVEAIDLAGDRERFVVRALERFEETPDRVEYMEADRADGQDVYHYARPMRESDMRRITNRRHVEFPPGIVDETIGNRIRALLVIDRRSEFASRQLLVARVYIVAAAIFGELLAILVFYFILKRLILSPVRSLTETAEKIQAGDTSMRASITTGDEFEELSSAFNSMLERMSEGQQQLRSMNETLDLRLNELAEANFALFESNRLKGEFLASVSHELRTPLNSIIGFSELLDEMARNDPQADPKRHRYLTNILSSSRALQEMINDLLEMAKIEAGRVELSIEPTNIYDLLEGLQALMRPQAQRKNVVLEVSAAQNLPLVETDAGKLQQILYNFLSNATKFSPDGATVTMTAEREHRPDKAQTVRIGVVDRGPGIPHDMQDVIFEKFRQVDASHTREHQGVGLGLAICRELAELLGATVSVVSEPGEGAAFYVEVPVTHEIPKPKPLMQSPA